MFNCKKESETKSPPSRLPSVLSSLGPPFQKASCPMEASQWRSVELPRLSHRHISALIPLAKLQSAAVLGLPDWRFLTPPTALAGANLQIQLRPCYLLSLSRTLSSVSICEMSCGKQEAEARRVSTRPMETAIPLEGIIGSPS